MNMLVSERPIGAVLFDEPANPTAGWSGLKGTKRFGTVQELDQSAIWLGNQSVKIPLSSGGVIQSASFLPLSIDEIAEDWGFVTKDGTRQRLEVIAGLSPHILQIAEGLADRCRLPTAQQISEADTLVVFLRPILGALPTVENDGLDGLNGLLTLSSEVPSHYIKVSAVRPRLALLEDALQMTGVTRGYGSLSAELLSFVKDEAFKASWSAGVVAQALFEAIPDRYFIEKVIAERHVLAFADLGYPMTYDGRGRFTTSVHPDELKTFATHMIETDFAPTGEARRALGFDDIMAARPLLLTQPAFHQELAWNLDAAAVQNKT
jgi:hypothetical protein